MENSKVISTRRNKPQKPRLIFNAEEKKRLVDYFSLLIEIDQKNKRETNENKTN